MDFQHSPAGRAPPWDINIVVEIPLRSDETFGAPVCQPGNFGFVPGTAMDDGEPCEALVVGSVSVLPGAVLRSRPIGLAELADGEGGPGRLRLLAAPLERLHPFFAGTTSFETLPAALLEQAEHFLTHLRDLPRPGVARLVRWGGADEAARLIERAIESYRSGLRPERWTGGGDGGL